MQQLGSLLDAEKAAHSRNATSLVSDQRSKYHCLSLELAAGWFFFGEDQKARKILDDARGLLFAKELYMIHQAELAAAYLDALGQAPMDFRAGPHHGVLPQGRRRLRPLGKRRVTSR